MCYLWNNAMVVEHNETWIEYKSKNVYEEN